MNPESIMRLCAVTCHPESPDSGQEKASKNSLAHRRNRRVSSTQHGHIPDRGVLLFGSEPDLSLICLQPHSPTPTPLPVGFLFPQLILLATRKAFRER